MTSARDQLLASHQKLLAARKRRDELKPARMQTLKTDPEFTSAVAEVKLAHAEFDLAAQAYCEEVHHAEVHRAN